VSYALRYRSGTRYAHLNRAAFPWTYPTRDAAEAVRQACASTEDIEIVEEST